MALTRAQFTDTIQQVFVDPEGRQVASPLDGVTVTVYKLNADGSRQASPATIYTGSGGGAASKSNPFITDDGKVEFFANFGDYEIDFVDTPAARVAPKTITWTAGPGINLLHRDTHKIGGTDPLDLSDIVRKGTLAARPAVSSANTGMLYFASDDKGGTLHRSSGVAWDKVARTLGVRVAYVNTDFYTYNGASVPLEGGSYLFIGWTQYQVNKSTPGAEIIGYRWQRNGNDVAFAQFYQPDGSDMSRYRGPGISSWTETLAAGTYTYTVRNGYLTLTPADTVRGGLVVLELS